MKSSQCVDRYKLNELLDHISNCYVYHDLVSSYALYVSVILLEFIVLTLTALRDDSSLRCQTTAV